MATPTTSFHAPGPGNVFIPQGTKSNGATDMMQVEFSRNPSSFTVNRYAQFVTDAATAGFYVELDTDQAVRVVNLHDFEWPDGNDAPDENARDLRWRKFFTNRRSFPFRLGNKTINNATYDIIGSNSRMSATQAMTARTLDAVTVMTATANWAAAQRAATVDALLSTTGASWVSSSTSQNFIKRSVQTVKENILLNTGGAVNTKNIVLVIGPDIAHQMSQTAEVLQYLVNHDQAISAGLMNEGDVLDTYGLPSKLYGVNLTVEDAVRVTNRKGTTTVNRTFMMGNNAVFLSRVGGLTDGVEGAPTLSTLTGFVHEDFTVETLDQPWDRRMVGRVVDDYDFQITASISGFLISDVTT